MRGELDLWTRSFMHPVIATGALNLHRTRMLNAIRADTHPRVGGVGRLDAPNDVGSSRRRSHPAVEHESTSSMVEPEHSVGLSLLAAAPTRVLQAQSSIRAANNGREDAVRTFRKSRVHSEL